MQMGIASGEFDVVWCIESVCHAPTKRLFLAEAYRALKLGGRIAIADTFLSEGRMEPRDARHTRRWLDAWAIPNMAKASEFGKDLEEVGFGDVRFQDVTKDARRSSRLLFIGTMLVLPIGIAQYLIGNRTKVQTWNMVAVIYHYLTLKKDL